MAKKNQHPAPYKSEKYPHAVYAEAADYIDSIGLDATQVLVDGMTEDGYWDRSSPARKQWRKWPSREVGFRVLELMRGREPR